MRVIGDCGKLTSNDKTWSYLPHLHVRERERGGWKARHSRKAWITWNTAALNMSKAPSLKLCYCNPDCSVNKEWYYLGITHTQEWSQSPGRVQTRHLCVSGRRQLCLCPWPGREPGWKHHCYFTEEVCKLLQAKIDFFLARQWRLKPLNPALLESIRLAVTEKSIPDKAKPHNLPFPWCWWLSSHSVCGKYHYPHYGDSIQDRDKLGYACPAVTDTCVDISALSWLCHHPEHRVAPGCRTLLLPEPLPCSKGRWTPPADRAGQHRQCKWFGNWSEAAQGNDSCSQLCWAVLSLSWTTRLPISICFSSGKVPSARFVLARPTDFRTSNFFFWPRWFYLLL